MLLLSCGIFTLWSGNAFFPWIFDVPRCELMYKKEKALFPLLFPLLSQNSESLFAGYPGFFRRTEMRAVSWCTKLMWKHAHTPNMAYRTKAQNKWARLRPVFPCNQMRYSVFESFDINVKLWAGAKEKSLSRRLAVFAVHNSYVQYCVWHVYTYENEADYRVKTRQIASKGI